MFSPTTTPRFWLRTAALLISLASPWACDPADGGAVDAGAPVGDDAGADLGDGGPSSDTGAPDAGAPDTGALDAGTARDEDASTDAEVQIPVDEIEGVASCVLARLSGPGPYPSDTVVRGYLACDGDSATRARFRAVMSRTFAPSGDLTALAPKE